MSHLAVALTFVRAFAADVRQRAAGQSSSSARDVGASTLEIVVIALGLFLVAGVLVAAITAAVNTRLAQIN
ncbi:hypothetical protein FHN55_12320 [Streptomyces sp. NP160]|uniref:hypothetical protein n=1 Tax=Streptomyces sp. NP160 TaxID=2586637 RepID=UPI00111B99D3|nr:hypothetical protein [Streptomyces sp. NP160]TNM66882.1 hypothetical protein FHN55_12320 [Streptomyces sp. NP160]